MATHERDQPHVCEVLGRRGLVHVGRSCIPPWTLTVTGTSARTLGVETKST
jgi:hypothetical protein